MGEVIVDLMDIGSLTLAGAALVWNAGSSVWTQLRRDRNSKELEVLRAALAAQGELARSGAEEQKVRRSYRDPLLQAAKDLHSRLHNLEHLGFAGFLIGGNRVDSAVYTTLYRLGRYFAVVEIIGTDISVLRLKDKTSTERAESLLREIGHVFASDRLDGGRFMIWREEQRAMGETCIAVSDGKRQVAGYSTFVRRLKDEHLPWFETLERDLREHDVASSRRFRAARKKLDDLIDCLSDDASLSWAAASECVDARQADGLVVVP